MTMGECLASGCQPTDSEVKFAVWPELAATWFKPTFIHVTRVNSYYGFATDDGTINIVLLIIFITIIIIVIIIIAAL